MICWYWARLLTFLCQFSKLSDTNTKLQSSLKVHRRLCWNIIYIPMFHRIYNFVCHYCLPIKYLKSAIHGTKLFCCQINHLPKQSWWLLRQNGGIFTTTLEFTWGPAAKGPSIMVYVVPLSCSANGWLTSPKPSWSCIYSLSWLAFLRGVRDILFVN